MALFADTLGILGGMFGNVMIIILILVVIAVWVPVWLFVIKYPISVVIREKIGMNTITWYTKAGIQKIKKHNREELRIMKSKLSPWNQWTFPILDNSFYHSTKKGKKFLEFYKIGDHSADMKPIPPINSETLVIRPTDVKIYDWLSQGMLEDARHTREAPDTLAKWTMIGLPVMFIGALVVMFIVGMTEMNEVMNIASKIQQDNVKIQDTWNDNIRIAKGVQSIRTIEEPTETEDKLNSIPGVKLLNG